MRKNLGSSKYLELPHSRAYQRHRFEEIQHGRTFVDRHYYRVLMEAMVSDLYDPEQKRRELLQEALSSVDISDLPKPTQSSLPNRICEGMGGCKAEVGIDS